MSTAFAHLSKAQIVGLVYWSVGIALTGSSGISQISALLAQIFQQKEGTVFQRLREWYLETQQKSGDHRRELNVTSCFGPLLSWIIRLWAGNEKRLALALDATTLGDRWTVLAVCVVIRGCSIPVAWKVIGAHAKGSWRPYWQELLKHLKGSIPPDWQVLVLADRGLYARWLFEAIVDNGWHPFLRINMGVKARALGENDFAWISRWVPTPGTGWQGTVECFVEKKSRLICTLLMQWQEGYEHPWVVITDLAPQAANVAWYGLRTWVECGFKDFKSGGFGWHHEKMQEAGRVERLWLAMAVAMVWTVSLGTQAESQLPVACPEHLSEQHIARKRMKRVPSQPPVRRLSCAQRGRLILLAALLQQDALPVGRLLPEIWPETVEPPKKVASPSKRRQRDKHRQRKRRQQKAARRRKAAA
ncbi:MAG TPA: transposase [Ktedonobacteraceae bacterium]